MRRFRATENDLEKYWRSHCALRQFIDWSASIGFKLVQLPINARPAFGTTVLARSVLKRIPERRYCVCTGVAEFGQVRDSSREGQVEKLHGEPGVTVA